MNYKLAKQLKDAGFPQASSGFYYWNRELLGYGVYMGLLYEDKIVTHSIKVPTLSELIEVCGNENFFQLTFMASNKNWFAECDSCQGKGSTPEEAVARLWLELKKDEKN